MHALHAFDPLAANHTVNTIDEAHPPTVQRMRAYRAKGGKADETVFVDVRGDQANLIQMGSQHDALALTIVAPFAHNQVAERIHTDVVRQVLHLIVNQVADRCFVPGGRIGFDQFLDQCFHESLLDMG